MIRIVAAWLATVPLDMRAGTDTALARVVAVFGATPAMPICSQQARQPHEGAGARRHRHLAGRSPSAPGQVRLAGTEQ